MSARVHDRSDVWDRVAEAAEGTADSPIVLAARFDLDDDVEELELRLGERGIETCAGCGWWLREMVGDEAPDEPLCEDCIGDDG